MTAKRIITHTMKNNKGHLHLGLATFSDLSGIIDEQKIEGTMVLTKGGVTITFRGAGASTHYHIDLTKDIGKAARMHVASLKEDTHE